MKFRTTRKAIRENYNKIIEVGYCDLQYLLHLENPIAYTGGSTGWYADIYDINDIALVTGYRPFGNISPDYKIINKYNEKAEKIILSNLNYEEQKKKIDKLLDGFIEEVTK